MTGKQRPAIKQLLTLGGCLALASVLGFALTGCEAESPQESRRGQLNQSGEQSGLFESASDNLDRLEQFDAAKMLSQICDRLNQWVQQDHPTVQWQIDPLLAQLPAELRALPALHTLPELRYRKSTDATLGDDLYLQQNVWLKDISQGARADQFDDVSVAERLFDWTIRNIQLEPDRPPSQKFHHFPYETLLQGRGPANERAWVFILLARQQGLDAVMLGIADENGENIRPWLPALFSGGELYLFDTRLGVAIPGPGEQSVATLKQLQADPQLLRNMDVDAENPYPVQAADLKRVVAQVEALPQSESKRMALVESHLAGKRRLALTSPGSILASRVRETGQVQNARLWNWPFQVWLERTRLTEADLILAKREMRTFQAMPILTKARAMHFKGIFDNEQHDGAKRRYMDSRHSEQQMDAYKIPKEMRDKFSLEAAARIEAAQVFDMQQAKQAASLWLGLVAFEEENYDSATDWFDKFTLKAAPTGPWASSARYNLARTYEAQGDMAKAVALYDSDTGPQAPGNKLRARWLQARAAAKKHD